ncbi:hypothetical protein P3X46_009118, partial [Hevea brasiliensis]
SDFFGNTDLLPVPPISLIFIFQRVKRDRKRGTRYERSEKDHPKNDQNQVK